MSEPTMPVLIMDNKGKPQKTEVPTNMQNLPKSVLELFQKAPKEVQENIGLLIDLINQFGNIDLMKDKEKKVEVNIDYEQLEEDFKSYMFTLNHDIRLRDSLLRDGEQKVEENVYKFIDILWENRGKDVEEVEMFNNEYYEDYTKQRTELLQKIERKQEEINNQQNSIEKTQKQKRLTEQKEGQMKVLKKEKKQLKQELSKFEEKHGNGTIDLHRGKGIAERRRKEKASTEFLSIITDFLNEEEFSVLIDEAMDDIFVMPRHSGYSAEQIKQIKESYQTAVSRWQEEHSEISHDTVEDKIKKRQEEAEKNKKIKKMMMFFVENARSYQEQKAKGISDEELNTAIKQMEICLHLLEKSVR